jgi:hypothetical protein
MKDTPKNGHKWLKHYGHYDHLFIKRLIALDGTSEFIVNSAWIMMACIKPHITLHNSSHHFHF